MLLMQYVMGMIIVGSSTIVIVEALRLFVSIVKIKSGAGNLVVLQWL